MTDNDETTPRRGRLERLVIGDIDTTPEEMMAALHGITVEEYRAIPGDTPGSEVERIAAELRRRRRGSITGDEEDAAEDR